ncbi:hypothetical protein DYH09_17580 [bacterium CPR1]|nr:hypothetical protein [bacterium CPR1]
MSFEPFEDFQADEQTLAEFERLKREDRLENLSRRYLHFTEQNFRATLESLGFVPNIATNGFTNILVQEENLVYTVGLFYSYSFPEIMLLGRSPAATPRRMRNVLQAVGEQLTDEHAVSPEVWQDNPPAFFQQRARLNEHLVFPGPGQRRAHVRHADQRQ